MRQDSSYDFGLIYDGDDAQPPTAVTDEGIDFINMLEELTPALAHEARIGPEDFETSTVVLSSTSNDVGILASRRAALFIPAQTYLSIRRAGC